MSYYDSFIKYWIPTYQRQIKNNPKSTKIIKENIYKNWKLTTKEKNDIWEYLMGDSGLDK